MGDSSVGLHVALRIRPLTSKEQQISSSTSVSPAFQMIPEINSIIYSPNQCQTTQIFQVDLLFDEMDTIETIYHQIGHNLIQKSIQGSQSAIFAYGMTSVGKTFTMQGGEGSVGLVQLATYDLLRSLSLKYAPGEYRVYASYIEIYNENIKDLVCENLEESQVIIREDKSKGIVSTASEHQISSYKEAVLLFKKGNTRRSVEATAMNYDSSRSHTIFKFTVEFFKDTIAPQSPQTITTTTTTVTTTRISDSDPATPPRKSQPSSSSIISPSTPTKSITPSNTPKRPSISTKPQTERSGVLYLVDLAGSESVRLTGSSGQRVKESGKINQSLLALGRVIHSLFNQTQATSHISYRDSKLTRLLQPVLCVGQNSSMWMICCLTLANWCTEETRNTLEFADDIRLLRTVGVSSKSTNSLLIRRYREQKAELLKSVVAVEDLLISNEYQPEIIPAVGSVDIATPTIYSSQQHLESSSVLSTTSETIPSNSMSQLLRKHTQVIDDSITLPSNLRRRSQSNANANINHDPNYSNTGGNILELDPIHTYIDVNEVERIWYDIDDPIAALLRREALVKRHDMVETDANMKSASINLEKLRESAEMEAKIWAETIESSRLKAAIDTAEFNQKRAKIETLRIKAMTEKVLRLQQQAEAMAIMKREIYERLCMEIEEVQMRLHLEKLEIARELLEMRQIEKECRKYENDMNDERRREQLEWSEMKKEENLMNWFVDTERMLQELSLMKEEELLTICWMEKERELCEELWMLKEEKWMKNLIEKEHEIVEGSKMLMEELLTRRLLELERELHERSLMLMEERLMIRLMTKECELFEQSLMLKEERLMKLFKENECEKRETLLMQQEESLVLCCLEKEREIKEQLLILNEEYFMKNLMERELEFHERFLMIQEEDLMKRLMRNEQEMNERLLMLMLNEEENKTKELKEQECERVEECLMLHEECLTKSLLGRLEEEKNQTIVSSEMSQYLDSFSSPILFVSTTTSPTPPITSRSHEEFVESTSQHEITSSLSDKELLLMRFIETECRQYEAERHLEETLEKLEGYRLEKEEMRMRIYLLDSHQQHAHNPPLVSNREKLLVNVDVNDNNNVDDNVSLQSSFSHSPDTLFSFSYVTKQQVLRAQMELNRQSTDLNSSPHFNSNQNRWTAPSPLPSPLPSPSPSSRYVKWERSTPSSQITSEGDEKIAIYETE